MLNLIFGRSGFGKTSEAMKIAGERARLNQEVYVIVPEQFTFETERYVVHNFGEEAALNITVLSFKRLFNNVLSKFGGLATHNIDDCGRNVLMKVTLSQIGDMLSIYSKQKNSPAFVKTMIDAISEYKMCSVDADMLDDTAKKTDNPLLKQKLSDISLIMRTYCANVEASFNDPLDDLTRLAKKLSEHPFFDGKCVIIDAFKGFTAQEGKVIEEMLKSAESVYVTLCADGLGKANSNTLFSPVEKTARQLVLLAKNNSVKVSSPIVLKNSHRFNSEELIYLEKNVFRPDALPFEKETEKIVIASADNIYDEANFIATEITKLIRTKNICYKDIAVITRGTDLYDGIIDTVFKKFDIPLFFDARKGIITHPLMSLVLNSLKIITDNFRQDDILHYLKTTLAGFDTVEVSLIENYLLMWNLNGEDSFKDDWVASPRGFNSNGDDKAELEVLNELRQRFYDPIKELKENIENQDKAKALYDFLCKIGVREAVNEKCKKLEEEKELELSNEYAQIFEKLINMLDQIKLASNNVKLSSKDFADVLKLVIENSDLGSIPPSLDAVSFGDAERIRTDCSKYVFVIGLCEGVFPKPSNSGGLITDSERRNLIELGLELSESTVEKASEERFFAYKALSSASDGVYLTYPRTDASSKSFRPSYFLSAVKRIFPNCKEFFDVLEDPIETVVNDKTAFEMLASKFNESTPFSNALKDIIEEKYDFKQKLEALKRSSEGRRLEFQNPMTSKALYGDNIRVSPSRIEAYEQCKFLYFCRYGINAKTRQIATLDAPQIGTVIHFVLENILKRTNEIGLSNVKQEELQKMTDELLKEFADLYFGGLENKSERFKHLFSSLSETVGVLVEHMAKEFSQSGFKPCGFEVSIQEDGDVKPYQINLDDGTKIVVGGKVDRVDTMKIQNTTYLRVIDYKTGTKTFSLNDLIYGLNLQMFIYLFTLCQNGVAKYSDAKELLPAGVLYVPAKRPIVSAEHGENEEKIESDVDKELRMNGLVLNDADVILGMESSGNGKFIPASLKQELDDNQRVSYSVTGRSSVASLEQFGILKRHIEKQLKEMAKSLKSGEAQAIPVNGLGYNPCDYCDYSSVCGFETGSKTKSLYKIDKEDIYKKMRGEDNNGED